MYQNLIYGRSIVLTFGKVIKYLDKGFGFIKPMGQDLAANKKEVFFHISTVKEYETDLVNFSTGSVKELYFWFTSENGSKGQEVTGFWSDTKKIPQDLSFSILDKYSANLIDAEKSFDLFKNLKTIQRKESPVAEKNNFSVESLAFRYSLISVKSEELSSLLEEMIEKNFTLSSELSNYITGNKLGYKYPNIAGIVTMSDNEREWDFDGGFPKDIYRIICTELNLTDRGTSARAVGFKSYQESKNDLDILF